MIGHDRIVDLRMQVIKLGLVGFIKRLIVAPCDWLLKARIRVPLPPKPATMAGRGDTGTFP